MLSGQQTKTKEYLQVKFLQYLKRYQDAFTRPEYKFLQDMCLGILKGETVINNKIALNLLLSQRCLQAFYQAPIG
jgi:hypothetical protein